MNEIRVGKERTGGGDKRGGSMRMLERKKEGAGGEKDVGQKGTRKWRK